MLELPSRSSRESTMPLSIFDLHDRPTSRQLVPVRLVIFRSVTSGTDSHAVRGHQSHRPVVLAEANGNEGSFENLGRNPTSSAGHLHHAWLYPLLQSVQSRSRLFVSIFRHVAKLLPLIV